MAFDLELAVQQGFNRDPVTNDWQVDARNLEIRLEDHGGVSEFRVLDDDNVAIAVIDSDGYLSISGNAEVHGGHVLVRGESLTNTEFLTLQDGVGEVSVFVFDADPNGVISGSKGSLGLSYGDGYLYANTDDAMAWSRVAYYSQVVDAANSVTLQKAYDNDPDGGDAIIVTNAVDGAVKITGTEKLWVTATTGIDLDTGFDMDGVGPFDVLITGAVSIDAGANSNFTVTNANLTLETVNSGDVIIRIPSTGGDFVVDEGVGLDYIRAEAASNELRLGNTLTPTDVRVLNDLVVEGDLVVNGSTTTVNTEDLFVEDRLIRLNIGTEPSFNGTTGVEMEVGSDGYVEFHWDDAQSRWEFSIDRNVIPEAQTFRPIPYLADAPATLDLSSIGVDGYWTRPNLTAGASVVNTNASNFPATFGPLMTDDSVQAALEAIDGYLSSKMVPWEMLMLHFPWGNSKYKTIQDMQDQFHSAGWIEGGVMADVDGYNVSVTAGSGLIRKINDRTASLYFFDWVAAASISVPIDTKRFIGIEYTDPESYTIVARTTDTWNYQTDFPLGCVINDGGTIHIFNDPQAVGDHAGQMIRRMYETQEIARDNRTGGLIIGESGDRYVTMTAGAVWRRLNRHPISAIDTTPDGDFIDLYWRDGGSGWNEVYSQIRWPNAHYDDNSGTLAAMTSNYFANLWVYLEIDTGISLVYGQNQYSTVQAALLEGPPATLPLRLSCGSLLLGRIIFQKDAIVATEIQTVFTTVFNTTVVTDHNSLSGIGPDDHHPKSHAHNGIDGSGTVAHSSLTGIGSSDHHARYTDAEAVSAVGPHFSGDHNDLTNLDTDDHLQYLRTDGTRMLSAEWNAGWPIQTAGIRYEGKLVIDGYQGLVLDGSGQNVVPLDSCTDSLGDAGKGWTDLFVCVNGVPTSLIGDGDNDAPNVTSGAAIVGTNPLNFNTFGPDMFDSNVQSALEAIDGYLLELAVDLASLEAGSTLQAAYDADIDGGDATISTNTTDGSVVIAGTESLWVTATNGLNLDSPFDMDSSGDFNVLLTGSGIIDMESATAIELDAYADSHVTVDSGELTLSTTTSGSVHIDGASGISLDGNGSNVVPTESCTDSLGDPSHGWTDLFVCVGGTPISLIGDGGSSAPNTTSGAVIMGTNPLNFTTFGPDMTDSTVQAALEAIDGYLESIITNDLVQLTLQDIYDNSCPNPTIVTTAECGSVFFEGTEQVVFNNDGGVEINEQFIVQGPGPVTIDVAGGVNISTEGNINLTSTQQVNINGELGIVLDGYGNNVIPATSCTDTLGDSTHGWEGIYLCKNGTPILLGGAGGNDAPNVTSGANVVGTNPLNFTSFGGDMTDNTVQAALEAIDGYLSSISLDNLDTTYVKTKGLDINGAVLNGVVRVSTDAGTPALDYQKNQTSRASWSIPVPSDWDGVSDIEVAIVWSAADSTAGNVEWRLEYKSLALTELASSAASTDDYLQAASGTADAIQSTTDNLVIPSSAVAITDEIIVINVVRRGSAGTDTYAENAQVHLVKYSYVAQNIV